jgi:hypothetical protein
MLIKGGSFVGYDYMFNTRIMEGNDSRLMLIDIWQIIFEYFS